MANTKKIATSVAAVATAAALLLGGTFAWQSISQTALNESSDVVNPGGRLHNDMWYVSAEENNNDIYVENFAEEDIFARVRLSEYMEIVLNEGTPGEIEKPIIGSKNPVQEVDADGNLVYDDEGNPVYTGEYDYEYVRFTDYENHATELPAGVDDERDDGDGTAYWTWQMGGETVYMPTFNMNKDSRMADLNGIYANGNVGTISNRVPADDPEHQYSDWTDWANALDPTKTANEIWDYDSNTVDELADLSYLELAEIIANGTNPNADAVTLVNKTHEARYTDDNAQLVSMSEWLSWFDDGEGGYDASLYDPAEHGYYWVYDDSEGGDGWVYWSAKLGGGEATGLLLNGTTLNEVMDDTWYYAINAEGQFCTPDDTGVAPATTFSLDETESSDGTGFYADGETVTAQALLFLEIIGMTDTTPGTDGEESAMTFDSYPDYYMGEDGPCVEIPMSAVDPSTWNLYNCSKGEFTLSSSNTAVTFEPYGGEESNRNIDMNIVIPAGTTESFTVTATAVESGETVTFTVIMVENNEPDYSLDLGVAGYVDDSNTEAYGSADHFAVGKKYSLRASVMDDLNPTEYEEEDYAVDFTVTLDNGESLTVDEDYTLTIHDTQFKEETGSDEYGNERQEYVAYADLTILNEDLIGEFVTVEACAPNSSSASISDVVIQEHRIGLTVQLFDTTSGAELTDFVVEPSKTFDVRVSAYIEEYDIDDIVIFDSRADHEAEIAQNITGFNYQLDLEASRDMGVWINENGQFVTGENPGFAWDEYDSFCVDATIKDLQVLNEDNSILWRGYATGTTEWLYQKDHVQLEFCDHIGQDIIKASQGKNGGVPLMVGLSTAWEVEGITFTMEGNEDTDTQIVPMEDEDLKHQSYYYRFVLGENETSEAITVTAAKEGYIESESFTFTIIYPTHLDVSIEGNPDELEAGQTYILNVAGYTGEESNLWWSLGNGYAGSSGFSQSNGSEAILIVSESETAEALTITVSSDDPYAEGSITKPVKSAPTNTG